jgi:hypothetical protein
VLSVLWRYAVRAKLVRTDVKDEEITLLTQRLTPGLAGYAVLIVVGLFRPVGAVIGYLLVALFFLLPVRVPRPFGGLFLRHHVPHHGAPHGPPPDTHATGEP